MPKIPTRLSLLPQSQQLQVINSISPGPQLRLQHLTHHLSTMPLPPPTTAPWRAQFLSHISSMTSPEFTFSTISMVNPDHVGGGVAVPRSRTCIFRGLWCGIPESNHNPAERNPAAYESDCPMLSTDVRMEKAKEVIRSAPKAPAGQTRVAERDVEGSDGGGPVEAVWWVKEEGIMVQWRMRGDAWVLGPDVSEEGKENVQRVRRELGQRMRVVDQDATAEWKWERELRVAFGAQSPGIKGQ
jgi:pyridoxamine 5'-phosphate oxidase